MKKSYYEAAGGVVLNARGEVLLLERDVPRAEGLRHEVRLPKGHIDAGEAADAAAQREVCEESGYCDLDILAPLGDNRVEYEHQGEQVTRHEAYFLMQLRRDEPGAPNVAPDSEEALFRVRWAKSLDEAEALLTYESEKLFARRAQQAWDALQNKSHFKRELAGGGKRPSDSVVALSVLMGPNDANAMGNVHGGAIMRLVDEAGALAAMRHARCPVVTVRLDSMTFLEPVLVGYLLQLRAMVNWVGHTSIEVGIRVEAENPLTGEGIHTNSAYAVYVALDEQGQPKEVPPLRIESPEERRRWQEAQARREHRLQQRQQREAQTP